jgi:hypothetical protein
MIKQSIVFIQKKCSIINMIFNQYENGSCDILFSDEEIKAIQENKKLHLSDEALRHFGNNLVKLVADWNLKFNEDIRAKQTGTDTEIIPTL